MKRSYVQIDGKLYKKGSEPLPDRHYVMGDIQPYRSTVTGEMVTSRSAHRNHLRRHGLIEVGNEINTMMNMRPEIRKDDSRKRTIAEILQARR